MYCLCTHIFQFEDIYVWFYFVVTKFIWFKASVSNVPNISPIQLHDAVPVPLCLCDLQRSKLVSTVDKKSIDDVHNCLYCCLFYSQETSLSNFHILQAAMIPGAHDFHLILKKKVGLLILEWCRCFPLGHAKCVWHAILWGRDAMGSQKWVVLISPYGIAGW